MDNPKANHRRKHRKQHRRKHSPRQQDLDDGRKSGRPRRGVRPLRVISPMHRANRQSSIYLGEQLQATGLPASSCHLLSYVHTYGPCPISEVVRVFGHKKTTMTSMLDRLEKLGMLERRANAADRRSFLISITRRGAKLAIEARDAVVRYEKAILSRVSAQDLAGYDNVMAAIADVTGVDVRRADATTAAERADARPRGPRGPASPRSNSTKVTPDSSSVASRTDRRRRKNRA